MKSLIYNREMNWSNLFSFIKKYSIFLIFIFSILVRFYFLNNNSVFFYFDQSRDAFVSRSILENKDIKIQGPSVSGTEDSIYHGVLYYYLIAPIYTISGGDPLAVSYFLAIIGSLSIFIVYEIGKTVFKSESIGLITALFISVSATSVHQHIWLSNPQLLSIFLLLSYLYLWKIFFSEKNKWTYALFGFLISLTIQSSLQSIVFLGSLLLSAIYLIRKEKKIKIVSLKQFLFFSLSFLIGISTMILTELLMIKRGVLNLSSLNLEQHSTSFSPNLIIKIVAKYFSLTRDFLAPNTNILIFLILLIPIIIFLVKAKTKQIFWLSLFFFSPLWLLLWHYRDPIHSFIGLEVVIYLCFSAGLLYLFRSKFVGKVISVTLGILFVFMQIANLQNLNLQRTQLFGIQKGALLSEQLELINKTYEIANESEFTFSTLTSPYAINTTWSYLYDWYGDSNSKIKPTFIGMPQNGYPGGNILNEATESKSLHFTIIEPDTTLSNEQINLFLEEQNSLAGEIKNEWEFGSLKLQLRKVSNNKKLE